MSKDKIKVELTISEGIDLLRLLEEVDIEFIFHTEKDVVESVTSTTQIVIVTLKELLFEHLT